jgi:CheY-like chemotaxis protein
MESQDSYQGNPGITILVADDMVMSRKMLKAHLGPHFNILEASNGLEVIEYLKNPPTAISCLLLDMMMPVMDGEKVLAFMRENNLLDTIPVIVITAMSDAEGKLACYRAGASEIIEKPFDGKILVNRIQYFTNLWIRARNAQAAAQQAPGESALFLTTVLDSLPQAVFVFGNGTRKIEYCNMAFEMLPGMVPSPAGRMLDEAFSPADAGAIMRSVASLLATRIQTPLFLDLGGRRFSLVFNAVLDETGNVENIIGTAVALSHGSIG